jgi:hypothetical protein
MEGNCQVITRFSGILPGRKEDSDGNLSEKADHRPEVRNRIERRNVNRPYPPGWH